MAEFVRVLSASELPDPGRTLVEVEGEMVALFHVADGWYALDDVCTHDGGPLADGELRDFRISCPRHGARFDIRTGAALTMPAVRPTRAHEVRVEDGGVWIRLRATSSATTPGAGRPTEGEAADTASAGKAADTASAGKAADTASAGKAADTASAAEAADTASAAEAADTASAAEAADTASAGAGAAGTEPRLCEDVVREILKAVKDPELFVNIVDLGLIYGVTLSDAPDLPARHHVSIDMTMTSPACPAGPQLIADTKRALGGRPDVSQVEVRIVMDPPWTPDRMTDAARDQLGIY